MRSDKIFDMIGSADEKYVADANKKRRVQPKILLIPAAAMVLTVAILIGIFVTPITASRYSVFSASYPLMVQYPPEKHTFDEWEAWKNSRTAQKEAFSALDELPEDFIRASILEFLLNTDQKNPVYSPLNVYIALAVLAETTDGNSRAQLLDLLGADSIEELRITANAIWNAHYCDDGRLTSVLASSIWLDSDIGYKKDTLKKVAENYYASSFSGQMGSRGYNDALRAWLNEQTGGLLTDQINNLEMDPETVLAIATTVYFNANWQSIFRKDRNDQKTFHGASADTVEEFMNANTTGFYYWGENFSAIQKPFENGGGMYFILPDEGATPKEVLASAGMTDFILGERPNAKNVIIHLSVPKFDVSSNLDLTEGLKNLGVTDIFDPARSDFSALSDASELAVTKAEHAARVKIDETGCTAAAYTALFLAGSSMPQDTVDFVLDRPFIFVITSEVGLPLFVGIVNDLG